MPFPTAAQGRVESTRERPWRLVKDLPGIAVYTMSEKVERVTTAPRELKRTVKIGVVCAVAADASVDDSLDALVLQVENALDIDMTLGGAAARIDLDSTDITVLEDGEIPVGCAHLVYEATYFTYPIGAGGTADVTHQRTLIRQAVVAALLGAAPVVLNDLVTADIKYPLDGTIDPAAAPHDTLSNLNV